LDALRRDLILENWREACWGLNAARKAGLEALTEVWAAIEAILGAKTREAIAMVMGAWGSKQLRCR